MVAAHAVERTWLRRPRRTGEGGARPAACVRRRRPRPGHSCGWRCDRLSSSEASLVLDTQFRLPFLPTEALYSQHVSMAERHGICGQGREQVPSGNQPGGLSLHSRAGPVMGHLSSRGVAQLCTACCPEHIRRLLNSADRRLGTLIICKAGPFTEPLLQMQKTLLLHPEFSTHFVA